MALEIARGLPRKARVARKGRPSSTLRFDLGVLITGSWLLGGGYADAWAHNHFALDSFFTPWHGILYSGGLAATGFVLGAVAMNWLRGYALPRSFPAGYGLTLLGVIFFICGGWATSSGIASLVSRRISRPRSARLISICLWLSAYW